jgi:hypothetical protein
MDVEPYLADTNGIDADALLDEWRWMLGEREFVVFRATALGDLILRDSTGQFCLLDMIEGKLRPLASTEPELWEVLADRNSRKTLLGTFIVRGLRGAGVVLGRAECYSPERPPILGGSLTNDNLRPCSLLVHSSIMGQIHCQVSELPPGATIRDIAIKKADA